VLTKLKYIETRLLHHKLRIKISLCWLTNQNKGGNRWTGLIPVWNLCEAGSIDWRGEKDRDWQLSQSYGPQCAFAGMNQIGLWPKLSLTNTISKATNDKMN